jgi:hypothetical protein
MPHELGVSFHSQFALNAARHNHAMPALGYAWRIVYESVELMPPKLGANCTDDVAARGHKSSLSYSLYLRHRASGKSFFQP